MTIQRTGSSYNISEFFCPLHAQANLLKQSFSVLLILYNIARAMAIGTGMNGGFGHHGNHYGLFLYTSVGITLVPKVISCFVSWKYIPSIER